MSDEEDERDEIQKNLFDGHGAARRDDPDTSKEAALKIKVGPLKLIVLTELIRVKKIQVPPGLTIKEVKLNTGENMETISPRFAPMRREGLIFFTGEKRQNPGGRIAQVWDVTDFGIRVHTIIEARKFALDYA